MWGIAITGTKCRNVARGDQITVPPSIGIGTSQNSPETSNLLIPSSRISVIVAQWTQSINRIDRQTLVTPLKQVSVLSAQAIKAH